MNSDTSLMNHKKSYAFLPAIVPEENLNCAKEEITTAGLSGSIQVP